jgi:hypothetical protein
MQMMYSERVRNTAVPYLYKYGNSILNKKSQLCCRHWLEAAALLAAIVLCQVTDSVKGILFLEELVAVLEVTPSLPP